jgi:asparagine synthase (glutamine-hydrolysing)
MSESIKEICIKLQFLLEKSVQKNLTDGILFSAGLDTSILATVASKFSRLKAFTCAFQGAPAPDIECAKLMATKLKLGHYIHYFTEDEMFEAVPLVVKTLQTFDPMEVRNSLTVFIASKFAKDNGADSVMTGDALDELFAGYLWLFDLEKEKLDMELLKMWDTMTFSSVPMGKAVGVEVKTPYLDPDFKSFAMKLDSKYKIQEERGRKWGKWIMRKAFEDVLPEEIAWRTKDPIEVGSGTTILPSFFNLRIGDSEFDNKRKKYLEGDKVTIRDKEHLFYYEVFRSFFEPPAEIFSDVQGKLCPQCKSKVDIRSNFCRICGAYPI